MQTPSIGRIVVYTDNMNQKHAAIICDPNTGYIGDNTQKLAVFDHQGSNVAIIDAQLGDGKGQWQWPIQVPSPNIPAQPPGGAE